MAKKRKKKISHELAIVCLILNIILLPGLGSLIGGKTKEGSWQIILLLGGAILGILLTITIIGAIIGIPLLFGWPVAAWIWGIITGVRLIQETQ